MDEERLISEFNEAKFQVFRLHNIWMECKMFRESGKLMEWRWKLDTATIELYYDAEMLDEQKGTNYVQQLKDLDKEIENAIKQKNLEELYKKLKEKEILLRKIQNEAGKGGKYKPIEEEFT